MPREVAARDLSAHAAGRLRNPAAARDKEQVGKLFQWSVRTEAQTVRADQFALAADGGDANVHAGALLRDPRENFERTDDIEFVDAVKRQNRDREAFHSGGPIL